MKPENLAKLLLGSSILAAVTYATPVFAQDASDLPVVCADGTTPADGLCADGVELLVEETIESDDSDDIVVTGSRIKRDTFTSIAPLQVLTTDLSQDVGLFDPSTILQRSESAAGQQIDATFQGFVLDNGPGSQTLNLRGLGPDRTLLLVNGRRLAPAGVEGAPTNPSINLLPGSLIDRNELLLDGASSVYGSDAVAGVANIILRKDFEGFEVFGRGDITEQGGNTDFTLSGSWGKNSDRGFIGVGAEYDFRDEVQIKDRDFLEGCDTHYEITSSGQIRTVDLRSNALVQARNPDISISEQDCKIQGISGRIFNPFTRTGSVYFTENGGNFLPNFNENTDAFGNPVDRNGDGIRDVDFQDVNNNAANTDRSFITEQKLFNVMAYGEYTLEGAANITPFFEANYSRAEVTADNTGAPQIFPSVPDTNAFNPCNLATGVDCRDADNVFQGFVPGSPFAGFALSTGFSTPVIPVVTIQGDRNNVATTQEQYRGVAGVRGDLNLLNNAGLDNWTWEIAGVYSQSIGKSNRNGIREDKLAFALGLDPTADYDGDGIVDNNGDGIADDYDQNQNFFGAFGDTQVIGACNAAGLSNPGLALADLTEGCVPVNLFAPSILGQTIGDFATTAERDYVFGTRNFDTTYKQTILSAFATGEVLDLPAGPLSVVVGGEWRKDEIESTPSVEASNGLLFGFFADRGAVGSKEIKEVFAEIDFPVIADQMFFRELSLNASGRITDEEFYGLAGTYSIKAGWRPVDSLLLKSSFGTSFRAPNLRENFLEGQSGFATIFDPCAVPDDAFVLGGGYDPDLDEREQTTLDNCIREGRDPTAVGIDSQGLNTQQTSSVEVTSGGSLDLDEETSKSFTAGFAFEQPFTDAFDFNLNMNYYKIKIEGAVVEPSSAFIVSDCFTRQDGVRSQFCDLIDTEAGNRQLVSDVAAVFVNFDEEVVKGVDVNGTLGKEINAFNKNIDLGLAVRANKLLERTTGFVDTSGEEIVTDFAGEFGFPEWTGRATLTADVDDFRFTWQTRYIGEVEQDAEGIDPLDDAFGNEGTGFFGDTCLGTAAGDVTCRDVGFADEYFTHTASVRYRNDSWTLRAGVSNIFNESPPLVDSNEVFAISNTPIGNGYDLDGRQFFASFNKKF